jgi:hypothetical protein
MWSVTICVTSSQTTFSGNGRISLEGVGWGSGCGVGIGEGVGCGWGASIPFITCQKATRALCRRSKKFRTDIPVHMLALLILAIIPNIKTPLKAPRIPA